MDLDTRRYVRREWQLALQGLSAVTEPLDWINHPRQADWIEGNRHAQLRLAKECGYLVPPTLVSNDPDAIIRFAREYDYVAVKSQGGVWREHGEGPVRAAFTQRCTASELDCVRDALRSAPVVVQPYIDKAYELRVTVIDEEAYFVRIDSQSHREAHIDWRRATALGLIHERISVSKDVHSAAVGITKRAGLRYATIDLIGTAQGDLVFLDLNPSGQYGWIEQATGVPVTRELARALLRSAAGP